ncbi:MAG: hypothetical protein J6V41_03495 [Kiritimatiellae bacterium]|nr:hypothetical protein [Kiritimatiellia bacterium]
MVDEESKPTIKPITIKPIAIKPIKITPINPAASEGATPNAANPAPQAAVDSSIGSPTIRLKPPTIASIPTPSVAPAAPQINLKAPAQAPITSKAPTTSMPKVVSATEDEGGNATLRIRPPAPAAAPAFKIDPVTPQAQDVTSMASKGKTSRISLDAVMDNTTANGNSPAPVGKLTSTIPDIAGSAPKSATVKISVPEEEVNTQQVTRKRTLRVKAPARSIPQPGAATDAPVDSEAKTVVRKSVSIKKPEAINLQPNAAAPAPAAEGGIDHIPGIEDERIMAFNTAKPVKAEKVNPFFILCSALSIVSILIIIFMFLAQCAGPDRSLTQYSSMPNAPEFGFPGKIQMR